MKTHLWRRKTNQSGIVHHIIPIICFIVLFAAVGTYLYLRPHAASGPPQEVSAQGTWCINREADNNVNQEPCDGSIGQQWTLSGEHLMDNGKCLVPNKYHSSAGTGMVYDGCSSHAADNWTEKVIGGGYYHSFKNPNSGLCLAEPAGNLGSQLTLQSCNLDASQKWHSDHYTSSGGGGGSSEAGVICNDFGYSGGPCTAVGDAVSKVSESYGSWDNATQLYCLGELWNRESGWNRFADNTGSGAYGIPQSLPASKMGAAANPPESSAVAQIKWGLGYIKSVYGTPCTAWAHELSVGWYIPNQPAGSSSGTGTTSPNQQP